MKGYIPNMFQRLQEIERFLARSQVALLSSHLGLVSSSIMGLKRSSSLVHYSKHLTYCQTQPTGMHISKASDWVDFPAHVRTPDFKCTYSL